MRLKKIYDNKDKSRLNNTKYFILKRKEIKTNHTEE